MNVNDEKANFYKYFLTLRDKFTKIPSSEGKCKALTCKFSATQGTYCKRHLKSSQEISNSLFANDTTPEVDDVVKYLEHGLTFTEEQVEIFDKYPSNVFLLALTVGAIPVNEKIKIMGLQRQHWWSTSTVRNKYNSRHESTKYFLDNFFKFEEEKEVTVTLEYMHPITTKTNYFCHVNETFVTDDFTDIFTPKDPAYICKKVNIKTNSKNYQYLVTLLTGCILTAKDLEVYIKKFLDTQTERKVLLLTLASIISKNVEVLEYLFLNFIKLPASFIKYCIIFNSNRDHEFFQRAVRYAVQYGYKYDENYINYGLMYSNNVNFEFLYNLYNQTHKVKVWDRYALFNLTYNLNSYAIKPNYEFAIKNGAAPLNTFQSDCRDKFARLCIYFGNISLIKHLIETQNFTLDSRFSTCLKQYSSLNIKYLNYRGDDSKIWSKMCSLHVIHYLLTKNVKFDENTINECISRGLIHNVVWAIEKGYQLGHQASGHILECVKISNLEASKAFLKLICENTQAPSINVSKVFESIISYYITTGLDASDAQTKMDVIKTYLFANNQEQYKEELDTALFHIVNNVNWHYWSVNTNAHWCNSQEKMNGAISLLISLGATVDARTFRIIYFNHSYYTFKHILALGCEIPNPDSSNDSCRLWNDLLFSKNCLSLQYLLHICKEQGIVIPKVNSFGTGLRTVRKPYVMNILLQNDLFVSPKSYFDVKNDNMNDFMDLGNYDKLRLIAFMFDSCETVSAFEYPLVREYFRNVCEEIKGTYRETLRAEQPDDEDDWITSGTLEKVTCKIEKFVSYFDYYNSFVVQAFKLNARNLCGDINADVMKYVVDKCF